MEFLRASVDDAARDDGERTRFRTIVDAALDEVLDLERLYDALPGVLDGAPDAVERFAELLDSLVRRELGDLRGAPPLPPPRDVDLDALPGCEPKFMVRPASIFAVRLGIESVSGDDPLRRDRYVAAVGVLWERAWIDELYRTAAAGYEIGGADRLAKELRQLEREIPWAPEGGADGRDVFPLPPRPPGPKLCGSRDDLCRQMGLGVPPPSVVRKWKLQHPSLVLLKLPASTYIDGLTSITPTEACLGSTVRLLGSFPATKPADVDVVVGTVPATVVSWTASEIRITVPTEKSGCVAFRSQTIEAERQRIWKESVDPVPVIASTARCPGPVELWTPPYPPGSAPCVGWNFLRLGPPKVDFFLVNGGASATVAPGEQFTLSWQTQHATIVRLQRVGSNGPFLDSVRPASGSLTIGPFPQSTPVEAEYKLTATNVCGDTIAIVKVRLTGPVIDFFRVNGAPAATVSPGDQFTLSWQTRYATTVRLQRVGSIGPFLDSFRPASGSLTIGPFTGSALVEAEYKLTATNAAAVATATVKVRLEQKPALSIVRIEVVQTIQTPTNAVRLVAGKRTLVRVFVDSGISNGFNLGAGANVQPNVTGRMVFTSAGTPSTALQPLNAGGQINAVPGGGPRGTLGSSLNFELPVGGLSGLCTIAVKVWVSGHEDEAGYTQNAGATPTFVPAATQRVQPILIADGGVMPTLAQFGTSLQGARTRLPIADTGFIANPQFPDFTRPGEDLRFGIGWGLLVNRLAMTGIIMPGVPGGGIRTAIVPMNGAYALNGIALTLLAPVQVSQATFAATFAHEMCHLAGADHAACPATIGGLDPRLPVTTEDIGLDVPTRTLIPAGRFEVMSGCTSVAGRAGDDRWPSIALYDGIMFGRFPIA